MSATADSHGEYFQSRFTHDDNRLVVWRHVVAYLGALIDRQHRFVELGAGYCEVSHCLGVDGPPITVVDLRSDLAEWAPIGADVLIGSCTDLSMIADGSVGSVFASNLLEHLSKPDARETLREAHRVLRPGGHFIAMQPNFRLAPRRYFDDFTHETIFTDESLNDLMISCGFEIARRENRFLPLSMKSRGSSLTFLVPWYLRSPIRPFAGQMLIAGRRPS